MDELVSNHVNRVLITLASVSCEMMETFLDLKKKKKERHSCSLRLIMREIQFI